MKDPKRSQVIRLKRGLAGKLEKMSLKYDVPQAQLVAWAVDAMEAKIEATGGKLILPFELGQKVAEEEAPYPKDPRHPDANP